MSITENETVPNGTALAAFVAGAIGVFAMGLISLLNAVGGLPLPTLYDPAGGVTGRTTLAVLIWLISWAVLHGRWRRLELETVRAHAGILVLIVVGILAALPPVWALFAPA